MLSVHTDHRRKGRELIDTFFRNTYRVDSRDVDLFGHCRPSALLGFLQEAAIQAALDIGISREEMLERYNAFWMLSRIRYELNRPLLWDEPLTVKTWHRGGRLAVMYREFDLSVGGESVGRALSAWVLADWQTRGILKLGDVRELDGTDGGSLIRTGNLRKPRLPPDMAPAETRRLHYSDTDMNRHVNNVRYADFACDALRLEALGTGKYISAMQISYLAECRAGEVINLLTGEEGGSWYVLGKDGDGRARFDAVLTLDN